MEPGSSSSQTLFKAVEVRSSVDPCLPEDLIGLLKVNIFFLLILRLLLLCLSRSSLAMVWDLAALLSCAFYCVTPALC